MCCALTRTVPRSPVLARRRARSGRSSLAGARETIALTPVDAFLVDPVAKGLLVVPELAREAVVLLAESIDRIGDPFALPRLDSNGRQDVEYFRCRNFADPYDERVRAQLAEMTGQLSTGIGAAIQAR